MEFWLGAFFGFVAVVLLVAAVRDWGYQQGFQDGRTALDAEDAGVKAEREWWRNAEAEVDAARQKIWREGR